MNAELRTFALAFGLSVAAIMAAAADRIFDGVVRISTILDTSGVYAAIFPSRGGGRQRHESGS